MIIAVVDTANKARFLSVDEVGLVAVVDNDDVALFPTDITGDDGETDTGSTASTIRGNIPPRMMYAIPNKGGTTQLEQNKGG
jgi:hypothetical protein